MKHSNQTFLPTVPDMEDKQAQRYLVELRKAIERMSLNVFADLSLGSSRFQVLSAAAPLSSLDKGQMKFVTSGGSDYLFVRLSTVTRLATLSTTS